MRFGGGCVAGGWRVARGFGRDPGLPTAHWRCPNQRSAGAALLRNSAAWIVISARMRDSGNVDDLLIFAHVTLKDAT
jgi:hypothetical protein